MEFAARQGADGNSPCDIPTTATAINTNTIAVGPTARSYLTLFPGDVANPNTSNLNFVAGQAPSPNAATIPLSATGTFKVFNFVGTVNVVIDVNGYYQPSTNVGVAGPPAPPGQPSQQVQTARCQGLRARTRAARPPSTRPGVS